MKKGFWRIMVELFGGSFKRQFKREIKTREEFNEEVDRIIEKKKTRETR